nr:hypothetical protein CFP56_60017 [Quercus suber]
MNLDLANPSATAKVGGGSGDEAPVEVTHENIILIKSKAQTRKVKSVVVVIVERSGGQQRKASKELQPSVNIV